MKLGSIGGRRTDETWIISTKTQLEVINSNDL